METHSERKANPVKVFPHNWKCIFDTQTDQHHKMVNFFLSQQLGFAIFFCSFLPFVCFVQNGLKIRSKRRKTRRKNATVCRMDVNYLVDLCSFRLLFQIAVEWFWLLIYFYFGVFNGISIYFNCLSIGLFPTKSFGIVFSFSFFFSAKFSQFHWSLFINSSDFQRTFHTEKLINWFMRRTTDRPNAKK